MKYSRRHCRNACDKDDGVLIPDSGPQLCGSMRLLLDAKCEPLHVLQPGQRKGIQNQRVTLVEGDPEEVAIIRRIYEAFVEHGHSEYKIADRVIEELKRTRCNGPRANRKLDDAARRCFGSVRAALEVAGLPCGQPERRTGGWSEDAVVEAIRQRHRNGESLVLTNREDRALYEAAKLWHGSWTAALAAAGFPQPPRDYYTADEVRLRIIDLYERALPLTFQSHNDVKLQRSCKKHFGGWSVDYLQRSLL